MEPAGFRIITSLKVVITSLKVVITNSKVVITSLKVVIIRKPAGSISFFRIYDFEFSYFREKNPFLREKNPFLRKIKSVFT